MKEEIIREIKETEYQKLKNELNKNSDYFSLDELEKIQYFPQKISVILA